MIWKEMDLIDISCPIIKEYDFLIMDLGAIRKVESIRIYGPQKTYRVEISCDFKNWKIVDKNLIHIYPQMIEVEVCQTMEIRYIRIPNNVHSFKVFARKHKGIMLSSMGGGWGDRMIAMLNAMYLAEQIQGFIFGFVWRERTLFTGMAAQEELFEDDYIEQYSYTNANEKFIPNTYYIPKRKDFDSFLCEPFPCYFGYYIPHSDLSTLVASIPPDWSKQYPRLWDKIGFLPHLKEAIKQAKEIFRENFSNETLAIHLRSGDIVFSDQRAAYMKHGISKVLPIEIAMEIIKANNHKTILLIGENIEILKGLQLYFKHKGIHLYLTEQFMPKNLNDSQVALFEITLLSCCKKIYSYSGFARLASLIGECELIDFRSIFSTQQQFEMLERNFNLIATPSLYRAYSLWHRYTVLEQLLSNMKECRKDILKQAIVLDDKNVLFTNTLNDLLNQEKKSSNKEIEIFKSKIQSLLQEKSKLESLTNKNQKRINELDNAKIRIHNHLAYKLGSAMILNSKSLLGYIRMPYVLSYIKESHRREQQKYQERIAKNPSLKLPKLESYPDYQESLKEKECFTYKLGVALIKANNVRGGGEYLLICNSSKKCVG